MKQITLFDDLGRYLADLEEILPEEDEFLANKESQYAVSMIMMNIINTCLDIAHEVIRIKGLPYPMNYRETFGRLEKAKIIPATLTMKLNNLVSVRNLLAHEYGTINLELLYEQASSINFIEKYIKSTIIHFK